MRTTSVSLFFLTLLASPLVSAHGKIAVASGDLGGNGTGMGILGGIVPGAGPNSKTEVDTTTFNAGLNNCGETEAGGVNKAATGIPAAMALSGNTLPQISTENPSISGTYHVVTSDGGGPLKALVDTTGEGTFKNAVEAQVTTQVPGKFGEIRKTTKRWEKLLIRMGLMKRATNINEDFPFSVSIPAGTTCTGTVAGQSNVCMVKIVNPSLAGPFGGCVAVQQASGSNSTAARRNVARKLRV